MKSFEEVEEIVKSRLSEKRFYHSQCVKDRCVEYAKIYGEDVEKARLVGIAHDVAKEMSHEDKIKFMHDRGLEINKYEIDSPGLLHAPVGSLIAKEEFGYSDDMVKAIATHTMGDKDMSLLAEILFVADSTGIDRKYEGTQELYEMAKKDLKAAVIECMNRTIKERIDKGKTINPQTIDSRNEYILRYKNDDEK